MSIIISPQTRQEFLQSCEELSVEDLMDESCAIVDKRPDRKEFRLMTNWFRAVQKQDLHMIIRCECWHRYKFIPRSQQRTGYTNSQLYVSLYHIWMQHYLQTIPKEQYVLLSYMEDGRVYLKPVPLNEKNMYLGYHSVI